MASKKYAYYNKGNKIAIVEQSVTTSGRNMAVAHCTISGNDNKTDCEAAGGQWIPGSSGGINSFKEYTSPVETIINGLEIEYSYVPDFNLTGTGKLGSDVHRFIGWGSNGLNLVLFTFGVDGYKDISSLFSAGDYVYLKSGRWQGVHTVKSVNARGKLILETKCNLGPAYISIASGDFSTSETFVADSGDDRAALALFNEQSEARSTRYIFVDESAEDTTSGFFSLKSGTVNSTLYFNLRYVITDASLTLNDIITEAASFPGHNNDAVTIYNVFYEPVDVCEGVDKLDDEDFDIDITRGQAMAIVYFLKSKLAEDSGDLESSQFFMREFKRQVEKSASSRKYGPNMIQGFWGMRR